MFVRLDFFLSRITFYQELPYPQADRVLSSAKSCIEAFSMKKNKSLIERLKKTGPSIDPCGTPEKISL